MTIVPEYLKQNDSKLPTLAQQVNPKPGSSFCPRLVPQSEAYNPLLTPAHYARVRERSKVSSYFFGCFNTPRPHPHTYKKKIA